MIEKKSHNWFKKVGLIGLLSSSSPKGSRGWLRPARRPCSSDDLDRATTRSKDE
jgi:hypothetical protein